MNSRGSQPSPWYFLTFALGCTGIAFTTFSLWSAWEIATGGDPIDTFDKPAIVGMVICFAIMYFSRLITWNRIPERVQRLVQNIIVFILVVAFFLALAAFALSFVVTGPHGDMAMITKWFGLLACLCQIATGFWVLKYQRETA